VTTGRGGEYGVTPSGVHLREITDDNQQAVCALHVRPDQERFVASVTKSLDDAAATPEANPWYRAIYSGDEPVGFVMLSWNVPPSPGIIGPYFLWRLLIDQRHQGRGFGREALTRIVDLLRSDGATELLTSYVPGDGEPRPFYQRFGFQPTGEICDGEIVVRLALSD
jgi:diamine N-acetyltransferase